MTPLLSMGAAALGSWLLLTVLAPEPVNPELLLAMAGPLVSAAASWMVTERTQRSAPARVIGVFVATMFAKMMLFAAYVVIMVRLVGLRPVPFVVGFTGFFLGLLVIEALFLKRLLDHGMRSAPSA
jgi:hypothetical protein